MVFNYYRKIGITGLIIGISLSFPNISYARNVADDSQKIVDLVTTTEGLNDWKNSFATPISNYLSQFYKYLYSQLVKGLSEINPKLALVFEQTWGALGLPDPTKVSKIIFAQIAGENGSTSTEIFQPNTTTIASVENSSAIEATVNSHIQAILGQEGQERLTKEMEKVTEMVSESAEALSVAEQSNISQNVLKALAKQNTLSTSISQATYLKMVEQNISTAYMNQSLKNISATLAESKFKSEIGASAEQLGLYSMAVQFGSLISPKEKR